MNMAFDFIITEQRFETIRDQVAAIIFTELQAQAVLRPTELEFLVGVWTERGIPFDREELPAVKVYFASSAYDDDARLSSAGTCQINVEVTAKGKSTEAETGDVVASKTCQKLIGVIRYILKNPTYNRLAFTGRPYIKGTTVTNIRIGEPTEQQEGFRVTAGQLILSVRYEEDNGDLEALPGTLANTTVKIDSTEKGYKLEKIT